MEPDNDLIHGIHVVYIIEGRWPRRFVLTPLPLARNRPAEANATDPISADALVNYQQILKIRA